MPRPSRETLGRYALAILIHVIVVAAWYFWVELAAIPKYVMPTPLATIQALFDDYDWVHNTLITGGEIFAGYLLAAVVGIGLALAFAWVPWLNALLMPLIVSTNMIPKVALGPILIVWFSYGFVPNVVIAFSICFT